MWFLQQTSGFHEGTYSFTPLAQELGQVAQERVAVLSEAIAINYYYYVLLLLVSMV